MFATRAAGPVLQELEDPRRFDVSVNDAFRPVSRFFDRVNRPEQLPPALLAAMRVLTDPAETGAVTLALPQDVQAEAFDWPDELFAERVWHVAGRPPEPSALAAAVGCSRGARRPLDRGRRRGRSTPRPPRRCARWSRRPASRSARPRRARARCPTTTRGLGAIGATGTTAANALAREADVVIGVGTRWCDFTTASRSVFADRTCASSTSTWPPSTPSSTPGCRWSPTPGAGSRRSRRAGRARRSTRATARARRLAREWDETVERAYTPATGRCRPRARSSARSTGVRAARRRRLRGGLDARRPAQAVAHPRPKGYHVEYGYSCMGYEIAGGLGVKLAGPDREVFVMVGDGSYLMMAQELVTAMQERIKLVVVLVQNHGFASIGALSESVGSQRFGTAYRYRDASGALDGDVLPVDLAANAASLGADVLRAATVTSWRRPCGPRGADPHDRGARRDRPAGAGARARRPGGTCRSPRSRPSTAREGRPRGLRAGQADQRSYLSTATEGGDACRTVGARDHPAPHRRRRRPPAPRRAPRPV